MLGALLSRSLAVGLIRAFGMALAAILTVLVARMLGPEGLGTYTFAIVVISIGLIPVGNGWGLLTLRATSAAVKSADWSGVRGMMNRCVIYAALCSIAIFSAGLIFGLSSTAGRGIIGFVAAIVFFDQMSAVRSHYLRGLDHPALALLPESLLRPAVVIAFIVLFWWFLNGEMTVLHALTSLFAGALMAFLFGVFLAKRVSTFSFSSMSARCDDRAWLASAGVMALSSGLSVINAYIDILALGALASLEEVGIYRVAAQTAIVGGFGYAALNLVAAQQFAHFRSENDMENVQKIATLLCLLALTASLLLPSVLMLGGPALLGFVFGSAFESAYRPTLVLALGQIVCASCGMCNVLLLMNNLEKLAAKLAAVFLILNIILCVALIPHFGILGAAWANVIATGSWNIVTVIFARRRLQINASVSALLPEKFLIKLKAH